MNIDSIRNGIVVDHIPAGRGLELYRLLRLDTVECPVAVIQNAVSRKLGKKDIIKVDSDIPLNMELLGYLVPDATVNIIRDGELVEKKKIDLPERLTNVIFCKNPRCIVSTEQELPHIFCLTDPRERVYRCIYCETKADTGLNLKGTV